MSTTRIIKSNGVVVFAPISSAQKRSLMLAAASPCIEGRRKAQRRREDHGGGKGDDGASIVRADIASSGTAQHLIEKVVTRDLWNHKEPWSVEGALVQIAKLTSSSFAGNVVLAKINAQLVFDVGGHLAIVRAMETHFNIPTLQKWGSTALSNLMHHRDFGSNLIFRVGGLQIVLKSMDRYHNDSNVLKAGCSALGHLVTHKDVASALPACRCIPRIIRATQKAADDGELFCRVCHLVEQMCENDRVRNTLIHAGAASVLALTLETYPGQAQERVPTAARMALKSLLKLGYGT